MITTKLKNLLNSLTKSEIIEVIKMFLESTWNREIENQIIQKAELYIQRKKEDEQEKQEDKALDLFNEYIKAAQEYESYIFQIAKNHGIVEKNQDGKETFNWGKFFDNASPSEIETARQLESKRQKAYEEWQKVEKLVKGGTRKL